jgi:STE24 endopeptidase
VNTARAAVLIVVLALASAGVVAWLSRAPASLRAAEPGPGATDPALGAEFTQEQIDRGRAFRTPGYVSVAVGAVLQLTVLLVVARGPMGRLADALERVPGGWPVRALLAAVALTVVLALATAPLSYVRGYVVAHDWGLSTQNLGGWLSDQGRSLLVAAGTISVAVVAFYAVVRWRPGSWWVWGWGSFTLLTLVLAYLYPVIIAPLFFNFTPVADEELGREVKSMAAAAGIEVDRVLVADASRRTTSENAYVAGFGSTKQVVVYDTLLEAGDRDETLFIVAHELGHQRANHVLKNVALASIALLGSFALLAWLAGGVRPWSWSGGEGVGDLKALPLLVGFALIVGFVLLPLENYVSRTFERQADETALELTDDPDTATRTFRRLAFANIADLDPPRIAVWILYTHPPITDRIELFLAPRQDSP